MSTGTLHLTIVSARIAPNAVFDFEPADMFATIRCVKEQRSTKTARDQGRLPAWNESFTFSLEEKDMSKDIIVQVFGLRSELDELMGLARIPIFCAVGKSSTLCSLNHPSKGEIGELKAALTWKPSSQGILGDVNIQKELPGTLTGSDSGYPLATFDPSIWKENDYGPVSYPPVHLKGRETDGQSTFNDLTGAMAKLAVDKESSGISVPSAPPFVETCSQSGGEVRTYSSQGGGYPLHSASFGSYPADGIEHRLTLQPKPNEPQVFSGYPSAAGDRKGAGLECGTCTSTVYPQRDSSEYNYPPSHDVIQAYPRSSDVYPSYPDYPGSTASSENPHILPDKTSPYITRGISETKDKGKGHNSHSPYGYPPPPSYPPTPFAAPPGYPSQYPPPYGYPPGGYPPAPPYLPAPHGYPPAPHGYPPAPHGYPPAPHGYPSPAGHHPPPAYPPYGYSPPIHDLDHSAHYPLEHGHSVGYAGGAYVGHSSHAEPSKHHKHAKHSKHYHGYAQTHHVVHGHHHNHKKH